MHCKVHCIHYIFGHRQILLNIVWHVTLIFDILGDHRFKPKMFKPSSMLMTVSGSVCLVDHGCYLCFIFDSYTVLTIPCSLLIACWERAELLALLFVMLSFFCHSPIWCGYLIVSIPDLCLLPYLNKQKV